MLSQIRNTFINVLYNTKRDQTTSINYMENECSSVTLYLFCNVLYSIAILFRYGMSDGLLKTKILDLRNDMSDIICYGR